MAEKTGADTTPQNSIPSIDDIDFSNADATKEAFQKMIDAYQEKKESNKQLFARAKKAEGFELKDGNWVKVEKPAPAPEQKEKPPTKEPDAKPNELDFGQLAFYNTKSDAHKIEAQEDIDFLKQTMEETGKSQSDILSSSWFQSELQERSTARETANAVPDKGNRSGEGGVTDTDLAVAKYKETGELPKDFKTRKEVIDKAIVEPTKDTTQLWS